VKGQLHAPATLFLGKVFPVFSAEEPGWAPEPEKAKCCCFCQEPKQDLSAVQPTV